MMINQIWRFVSLAILQNSASSATCFDQPRSLLPRVLVAKDATGNLDPGDETYYSITGNDEFVVFGGTTHNQSLFYSDTTRVPTAASVITRMDLEQNTIRWMRTYDTYSGQSSHVEALALKDDDASEIAVYARSSRAQGFETGMRHGYLFVIRAVDGGHVTTQALRLEHDSDISDQRRFLTSSSAMHLNKYG